MRKAAAFIALAVALSWTPWLVVVAMGTDPTTSATAMVLWSLGGLGPAIAALTVAAHDSGRDGVRRIARALTRWRVGRWNLLLVAPLPIAVLAVLAAVATGPAELNLSGLSAWYLLPVMFISGLLFGGLEEVGWRGYLLPKLQRRHSALAASVIVGLVWSLWHAPLFLMEGTTQAPRSMLWFTIEAIALSVILTWAYNGTGGSLLLAVLAHAAFNAWNTAALQFLAPDALATFIPFVAGIMIALAIWIVVRHGAQHLSDRPRQRWNEDLACA